ncbi:MAG: hypothetical protein AAF921_06660 [Cyanobacteria bacterium P01_D01_bin.44]
MSLPAVLRYLPARLRPLQNPVVWMPALALAFVGIFAWEYKNHPEWLQWNGVDSQTALETGLTPEEQAGIAEIDTLDLLINEANSNSPAASSPEAIDLETASETEPPAQSIGQAPTQDQATPFADYLAQYQLPGGSANGANTAVQASSSTSPSLQAASGSNTSNSNLFLLSQPTSASQDSALSRALSDRAAANSTQPADSPQASQTRPNLTDSAESAESAGTNNLPLNQSGVIRGQLPNNPNVNFIRTTPAMSPPPGTTGYQPPASINLNTYDRTLNRSGQFTPGVPSTTAPAPSFEVRQPQQPAGVLPGQVNTGIAQPQTQLPGASGSVTTPDTEPSNAFDDFFD